MRIDYVIILGVVINEDRLQSARLDITMDKKPLFNLLSEHQVNNAMLTLLLTICIISLNILLGTFFTVNIYHIQGYYKMYYYTK